MSLRPIPDNYAPYTSTNALKAVIDKYRDRGLPQPLTDQGLESIGTPPSMTATTLRALLFFGLMDEGGNLTEDFNRIKRASSEEYPSVLAAVVRKAYMSVFKIIDPAVDDKGKITDAFRPFEPAPQRGKMVQLFLGLCGESGIIPQGTVRLRKGASLPRARREAPPSGSAERPSQSVPPPASAQPQPHRTDPVLAVSGETIRIPLSGFSGPVTVTVSIQPGTMYLAKEDRDALLEAIDKLMERSRASEASRALVAGDVLGGDAK